MSFELLLLLLLPNMESWYRKYLTWKKDQSQFGNLAILIKNQALIHCIKIEVRKYIYYLKEGLKIHNWRGRSYYQIRNFYNLIIYNTLNSSRNAIKKTYQGRVTPVEKKSTFWGGNAVLQLCGGRISHYEILSFENAEYIFLKSIF